MANLDDNIYAFALGLVNPAAYFDYPNTSFNGLASPAPSGGMPAFGGMPPYGGKKHRKIHIREGGGWFDDLMSVGKTVVSTLAPFAPDIIRAVSGGESAGDQRMDSRPPVRRAVYPLGH